MVKDSSYILPEFLVHHLTLVEHIFLIDHNSKSQIKNIECENITVLRANLFAYHQEECTNLTIDYCNIKENFDWLFVLDVDEFLPFKSRGDLVRELERFKRFKVISYKWQNGFSCEGANLGLVDGKDLRFYDKKSSIRKCAVNIRKANKNFYIPRSAHRIAYLSPPWWYCLLRGGATKFYKTVDSGLAIYHVVAGGLNDFEQKIANFKKMRALMDGVSKNGGGFIKQYPDTCDLNDLMFYVANYRVRNKQTHVMPTIDDFVKVFDFDHLDTLSVYSMRKTLLEEAAEVLVTPSGIEQKYIKKKISNNSYKENMKWFYVKDGIIGIANPD